MTLGERLRAERNKKGVTVAEVAKSLGLTQGAISQFENGIRSPSTGALVALAKYYNVSLDYLVGNVASN